MSIYTGTMRLNLMFHHWDHCWCARGGGRSLVPGDNITLASSGLTSHHWHYASLRLSSGPIIATITPAICNLRVKYCEMVIQNVEGGHTFPLLLVSSLLDWPNGLPVVRHSLNQIQLTHHKLSVDKLTLHTVDQYLYLPSETHPVKLFKLAVFKQLQ